MAANKVNETDYENNSVLIVDDDSSIRSYIRSVMNSLGVGKIIEASNGKDCLSHYQKSKTDIIFLDINMPDKNGVSVLKEILNVDENARVVMVSGDSTFDNVKTSIASGAKGFIAKPFTGKKFIDTMAKIVAKNE